MEREESILDAIFDEDNFEDVQDMMDIEEGELVGHDSDTELGQNVSGDVHAVNQESGIKNNNKENKKYKKRKNRRKKGSSGPKVIDIDRFFVHPCYISYIRLFCLANNTSVCFVH